VASPKASIAFPASVPGPQIVLIDVAVPDVEKLAENNLLVCLDEIEVVIIAVKSGK
jgi:hypothetical protein